MNASKRRTTERKLHRVWAFAIAGLIFTTAVYAGDGIVRKPQGDLIKDSYTVTFNPGRVPGDRARDLARLHGAEVKHVYEHLHSATFEMSEDRAQAMAANPNVALVEQDVMFYVSGDQGNPTWGIDRIDEPTLPDDNNYHWDFDGSGVTVFVLDTGIRTTHDDFKGRASWGIDCTGEGQSDGHGHGTHVAGTAGSATYGVAKNADLVAVKVCNQFGSCPSSAIACGVNYVIGQKNGNPSSPMVANMSLRGPFSQTSNNNVANGVASGVFFAVAAGNDGQNACNYSPASEPTAYTVGATASSDARSSFSNFGTCLDIFAPGASITSTWNTSNTATNTISGTSMASPHVAGAAALVLDEFPAHSPSQVDAEFDTRATSGVVSNPGSGSPNRLLYTLTSVNLLWTAWLDRDNPSGSGDYETFNDFVNAGQIDPACIPIDIQCQTTGGTDWTQACENYTCSPTVGGVCRNSQQPDLFCQDYRVRFRCASWTGWLDRDNPSGSGDYETRTDFLSSGQLPTTCTAPGGIECQTTSGTDWSLTGEVYTCNTSVGGACRNSQQPDFFCLDYRARFLCPCTSGSC